MSEQTGIVEIPKFFGVDAFNQDAIERLKTKLKSRCAAFRADVTTPEGRKAIASQANKVARSKTLIDSIGKQLVEDQRAAVKRVDAVRKDWRDFCDEMKAKVREPLTEFETREAARVERHESALAKIADLGDNILDIDLEEIQRRVLAIPNLRDRRWEEFIDKAHELADDVERRLEQRGMELVELNASKAREARAKPKDYKAPNASQPGSFAEEIENVSPDYKRVRKDPILDAVADAIDSLFPLVDGWRIAAAIADGKIPHVKIER